MRSKYILIFTFLFSIGLLYGCAGAPTITPSKDKLVSLGTASIDKEVAKPKEIFFRGGLQAWGAALGGALGGALTADAGKSDATKLNELIAAQQLDIGKMVYQEATRQLANKKSITIVEGDAANGKFQFFVTHYGFSKTHPFGSTYDVNMGVLAKLVSKTGEVLWQYSDFVTGLASDNNQGQSLDVYYSNPATLKPALETAARVVVRNVLANLPN
ncbi:MAG: hypothetical protein QM533_09735 [Cytophagales bacterium]|nr:hypothetical protein [Cytophagales bacterium]